MNRFCKTTCFKMVASILCVTYFLSSAHAAWVVDADGIRQVNAPVALSLQQMRQNQENRPVTCANGLDTLVREGATWNERCSNCTCTANGKRCDGPTCPVPYQFSHELTCGRWSSDGCCCEEFGCKLLDGSDTLVPLGNPFPRMPNDPPCRSCKCREDGSRSCVWQTCDPMACVDPVRVPGQCCPICPNNHTCVLPMKMRLVLPLAMVQEYEPVRESSPLTVAPGSPLQHTCYCQQGTIVATCYESGGARPTAFRLVQ